MPLNVQMLPNAKKGQVPTPNCLCSKMLTKDNSQKVGFLEAKVDRKAWHWSLTLIWGCTAGSPKVMLGREGDVYRLSKFTDSSCIKRRCCETRCWNKGKKPTEVKSPSFLLWLLYPHYPATLKASYVSCIGLHPNGVPDKEKYCPCEKAVGISFLKKTTDRCLGLFLG